MAAPLEKGWAGKVLVHLTDVPEWKRIAAAERLIDKEGLAGTAAMMLKMVAVSPRENPGLLVDAAVAKRVCGRRIPS